MKKTLKMAALMLCAAAMMTACNGNTSSNSDDNKMAQFEKKATEFKATLDASNKVIAERMDTVVQKVFYLDPSQDAYGVNPIKNILMHDYATDKTQPILPEEEKISDYLSWGELETSLLFYVNVLDNSLHYVTDCDDVKYDKAKGTIDIHKELMKPAGEDLEHNFTLSASSTDEEYAAKRNENAEIEKQLLEKWREENSEE